MRYLYLLFIPLFSVCCSEVYAQAPKGIQWQKAYGSTGTDDVSFMIRATDGGYLIGGTSDVAGPDGDLTYSDKGMRDYRIMKLDATGNKEWDRGYGGSKEDIVMCAIAVSDGGYLIGGASLSGKEGDKSEGPRGAVGDYWILKLDASGNKQWDKTLGSENEEYCTSMIETADGNFLIGGSGLLKMTGDVTAVSQGALDIWVVKLDKNGKKIWDKVYGGKNSDKLAQLIATADGGFVAVGSSSSVAGGGKTEAPKGLDDYWILKADTGGVKKWDKTIGSRKSDFATCITEAYNGGYLVAGIGGDTVTNDKTQKGKGFWVVRLDTAGKKKWDKLYIDEKGYAPSSVIKSGDGGYLLAGTAINTASTAPMVRGGADYLLMRLDSAGTKTWAYTLGGSLADTCMAMVETEDGYVLAGSSASPDGADKVGHKFGAGNKDYWIVKLAKFPLAVSSIATEKAQIANVAGLNGSLQIALVKEGAAQYQVYDMAGRKVSEGILLDGKVSINAQPGIYNIYIRRQGLQQMVRVMVY
ncbi:MAG: hypothetical protein EOP56_11400 [Sphingobacteriales bacterium]|nr:MAG: hypothetical protein EOP56_11400 [Sphingobacteriales bacterium]